MPISKELRVTLLQIATSLVSAIKASGEPTPDITEVADKLSEFVCDSRDDNEKIAYLSSVPWFKKHYLALQQLIENEKTLKAFANYDSNFIVFLNSYPQFEQAIVLLTNQLKIDIRQYEFLQDVINKLDAILTQHKTFSARMLHNTRHFSMRPPELEPYIEEMLKIIDDYKKSNSDAVKTIAAIKQFAEEALSRRYSNRSDTVYTLYRDIVDFNDGSDKTIEVSHCAEPSKKLK